MTPKIETPKGAIIINANGKAELKFNSNFAPKWTRKYSNAQKFVDSETLRLCEPFIPLQTSMLVKSGILGTDVGSGFVKWIAPYAAAQYYRGRRPGTSETGPLRGRYWFERMKEIYGQRIIMGARKLVGKS